MEYLPFEKKLEKIGDVLYALVDEGKADVDDVLWYQALNAYMDLCGYAYQEAMSARAIRRCIFQKKLKGTVALSEQDGLRLYHLPDGSTYTSLKDEQLMRRMVQALRESFRECHIDSDEGVALRIPQTPSALRAFLLEETQDRNSLLRVLFSLKPSLLEMDLLLTEELHRPRLSAAVPKEVIIMYCLEQGQYDWNYVNRLQVMANEYTRKCDLKALQQQLPTRGHYTRDMENPWLYSLPCIPEAEFLCKVLYPCCEEALVKSPNQTKNGTMLQFSRSRLEVMWRRSVLCDSTDLNSTIPSDYHGPYAVETVFRYREALQIPSDYPLLKNGVSREKVMSKESYVRLFNYRIASHASGSRHKVYSMRHGLLPVNLRNSVLMYSDIDHLPLKNRTADGTHAHNIKRYMILLADLMRQLLLHWKEHDFITHSHDEAKALQQRYFQVIRQDLFETGYSLRWEQETGGSGGFSRANPLDALLCLCLLAINPLECYNRVYELEVLQSYARDDTAGGVYPPPERIHRIVTAIMESGRKLAETDPAYPEMCSRFCELISQKLQTDGFCISS